MFRRLAFVAAIAATTLACSAPPTKEHEQAVSAVAAARDADAATYAPEELTAAQSALARYDEAVAQHDYRQALGLALEARDTAYEAAKRAADEKTAAEHEADRLLGSLEAEIRAGNARLAGASGPKPSAPVADRLRADLKAATPILQEARSAVGRRNYRAAVTTLTPIVENLQKDLETATPGSGRRGR